MARCRQVREQVYEDGVLVRDQLKEAYDGWPLSL
jgi:hypothetical protein